MINKATEDLIVSFEGERLKSYKDTGGIWTIGVGHTSDKNFKVGPNQTITREKSRELLRFDVKEAEDAVDRLVKVPINENQRGALVSFTFNLGEGQLKISTLLRKLNAGQYSAVPTELNKWVFDDGVKLNGLVRRRKAEGVLWNTPVINSTVPEKPVEEIVLVPTPEVPAEEKPSLWQRIIDSILMLLVGR